MIQAQNISFNVWSPIRKPRKNIIGMIAILAVISFTACSKTGASKGNIQNMQTEQATAELEPETEATAIENLDPDNPIELYINVLQDYIAASKTNFTVSFIDLNDDSTKEMVVFFGEAHSDGGYLFTIENGEAIPVLSDDGVGWFGQYGGFTYREKENIFASEWESAASGQGFYQISYYTMENGNAIRKDVAQIITQFDSGENKFYINDTEVENETYNRIIENYGLSEMSTVSYSDGIPVINGQMDTVYDAYNN